MDALTGETIKACAPAADAVGPAAKGGSYRRPHRFSYSNCAATVMKPIRGAIG